jgi:hypothetical protein
VRLRKERRTQNEHARLLKKFNRVYEKEERAYIRAKRRKERLSDIENKLKLRIRSNSKNRLEKNVD